MAIRDLLWACPLCKEERALRPERRGERCTTCRALFTRGSGALIRAQRPEGPPLTLSAAEWIDQLPQIEFQERRRSAEKSGGVIHEEHALLRTEIRSTSVAYRGTYLNRIELFGPTRPGILYLEIDGLTFRPEAGTQPTTKRRRETEMSMSWQFDSIRAVQPSSRTLQVRSVDLPLASIQIPKGSVRFWEQLLCAALQDYYLREGRGVIVEFQPRITTIPQR